MPEHGQAVSQVPGPPLYFTFLDGAFRYDCASCGQACCRGKGIALDARTELVPLLGRAPRLAPLVSPLPGGYVRLPDATDGCFFLRGDGFCDYEETHGRSAKFLTCRLFPYNRVFRAGAVRVVDYNSVVCPLKDAYGSGRGVTYRELLDDLASGEGSPLVSSAAELPEGARELRWHALEQGLLEASASHLQAPDYAAFAELQASRSQRHLGQVQKSPTEGPRFWSLTALWAELYGVDTSAEEWRTLAAATARALTLLTPSLRFNALFKRGAGPYRQHLAWLPGRLHAAWFLGTLAALVPGPSGAPPSPLSLRALTELYQAHAPLRDLLCRLDEPAVSDRPTSLPELPQDASGDLHAALRTLGKLLSNNAKDRRPLGALLVSAASEHSLPPALRALLPAALLRSPESLRWL